uniref:UPAR/Ly6 domain-containing protein n=1 Tax=Cyprinus carpio carpio TaxID=630221 RepID=A0A9J7ZF81_CYPCA
PAVGGIRTKVKLKYCAGDCQSGSINIGIAITLSVCCDADLCNSQDAPDPSSLVPSGKKCYSCDGQSFSNILSCSGTEDQCISATGSFRGQSVVVKGCVSEYISNTTTSAAQGASHCEGNLCNGV